MSFEPSILPSPSGAQLSLRVSETGEKPRAVVQIHHGLAEHAGRYHRFAQFLNAQGFHACAHDHRGHGLTTAPDAPRGVFASTDGWGRVVEDALAVEDHLRDRFPGLPLIVFGHSMGGVAAMTHAMARRGDIAGLAIWNANLAIGPRAGLMRAVLTLEGLFKKSTAPSLWMEALTFKAWGKQIRKARTSYDWLSRLPEEVDAYIADPDCGWPASISMWRDLVDGSLRGEDETRLRAMRKDLPIHLAAGGQDPAVEKGRAVKTLASRLYSARFTDVTMRFDPKARHETLNDEGRDKAMADFSEWAARAAASA